MTIRHRRSFLACLLAIAALLAACNGMQPLETVEHVDLERFMGDWYVIAHIPTFVEDEAYNAVESYALEDDGTVATTFTFREGGFDGELKTMTPRGFPDATANHAVWGMRFVWPIKADYRIAWLDEDYTVTIVGRNKRDYVWIMARTPSISQARYDELVGKIRAMGYDTGDLRRVPQRWDAP